MKRMKRAGSGCVNIRWWSFVVIAISAAILAYGFIDAMSYRTGYVSGYSRLARAVDAACVRGDVLDASLCTHLEDSLYGETGDGVYAANALGSIDGLFAGR